MRKVRVDADWHFHGLRAVILENEFLRAVILPEVGARIQQLVYKPRDIGLIWSHPRIKPARLPFGAGYDNAWCGGWDELFPNNIPENIVGDAYPDHGEVWAAEWDSRVGEDGAKAFAKFSCRTPISDVAIEKTFSLCPGDHRLYASYVLRNCSQATLPILWNLHIALVVSEHHELAYPPMKVRLEPSFLGTLDGAPLDFTWPAVPMPHGTVDLRKIPSPSEQRTHFFYGHKFSEGWCGLTDTQTGLACGVAFDPKVFRSCWLFGSFGGWRNLSVAVMEPSTGFPYEIARAVRDGTCPKFAPGEEIRTSVVFSVAESVARIRSITPEGEIVGC
ncbi:MAG TPA: DUF5107 domain-containing protein [Terriglobia bacterium]|nr:DUF5107 domain-containing protein [Terriglobia bacterium]